MRGERSGRILVAAMALALLSCSDDTTAPATSFAADLSPAKEVPAVTNAPAGAGGTAQCAINATSSTIACTVTYSSLSGGPTLSHIHLGNANANGSPAVNLCGTGAPVPACPTTASGTITSGDQPVTGTGNTFASVVAAMRNYGAYVNVHTTAHGSGEMRGQIFGAY
jgi:hypothetical protein